MSPTMFRFNYGGSAIVKPLESEGFVLRPVFNPIEFDGIALTSSTTPIPR